MSRLRPRVDSSAGPAEWLLCQAADDGRAGRLLALGRSGPQRIVIEVVVLILRRHIQTLASKPGPSALPALGGPQGW